ncbi:MAG: hypothetical protein AAF571_09025, partial [Verrucomicrobiota bacterium]
GSEILPLGEYIGVITWAEHTENKYNEDYSLTTIIVEKDLLKVSYSHFTQYRYRKEKDRWAFLPKGEQNTDVDHYITLKARYGNVYVFELSSTFEDGSKWRALYYVSPYEYDSEDPHPALKFFDNNQN